MPTKISNLKTTPNQLQTIILLTIMQKWRTFLPAPNRNTRCLEKMNSKVRGQRNRFSCFSGPQLYFVGQDNTAKPVSETLESFVTNAARKKLDLRFLEATILLSSAEPFVCPCYLNLKRDNYLNS